MAGAARVIYGNWTAAALTVLALTLAQPMAARAEGPRVGEPTFAPLPTPSLNFYGSPGLIDMPTAEMLPDGQFTTAITHFGGQTRITTTFQALPWLSGSFRYNGIQNWNFGGFQTYYDRGFDVRVRLLKERRLLPQVTLGLQDFIGTGIYAGEYIVATKTFATPPLGGARAPGRLKLTGGVGWGRLGSHGSIGAPFGANRPSFVVNSTGGQVAYDQWFRGPAALFGGVEWELNDRWGLKAEYSSDAYVTETQVTSVFQRKSNVNFGIEYQASDRTRLGAYYLYGSELGITAQFQLNPRAPATRIAAPAPLPVEPRPSRATMPEAWDTAWTQSATVRPALRDMLEPLMKEEGLALEYLSVSADQAELRFRNTRYRSNSIAVGRAARLLARVMPPSVETFRLVPVAGGMALSAVTLRRSDLEALEFEPMATDALRAVSGIGEATPRPDPGALRSTDLYPNFRWSLGPYFLPSYFDPAKPVRMDVGIELVGAYEFAPGWTLAGALRHRLAGNVSGGRGSNSVLPHVRTDQTQYAQADTTLQNLFLSYQWRPGRNLYARVSAGYFERMYGGLSAELLWKPVDSRIGLGLEANYARQRDFDQRLGFRDYSVLTGHASAYMELGGGYLAQVDAGRYLAGDLGATFALDRTFANGWSVGGYFTLTNVSAADFGEGSFDKGIRFSIPVNWFLGKPTRQAVGLGIRPVQRDGGQRLIVPGRLYGQVREAHEKALDDTWARVWE